MVWSGGKWTGIGRHEGKSAKERLKGTGSGEGWVGGGVGGGPVTFSRKNNKKVSPSHVPGVSYSRETQDIATQTFMFEDKNTKYMFYEQRKNLQYNICNFFNLYIR